MLLYIKYVKNTHLKRMFIYTAGAFRSENVLETESVCIKVYNQLISFFKIKLIMI